MRVDMCTLVSFDRIRLMILLRCSEVMVSIMDESGLSTQSCGSTRRCRKVARVLMGLINGRNLKERNDLQRSAPPAPRRPEAAADETQSPNQGEHHERRETPNLQKPDLRHRLSQATSYQKNMHNAWVISLDNISQAMPMPYRSMSKLHYDRHGVQFIFA